MCVRNSKHHRDTSDSVQNRLRGRMRAVHGLDSWLIIMSVLDTIKAMRTIAIIPYLFEVCIWKFRRRSWYSHVCVHVKMNMSILRFCVISKSLFNMTFVTILWLSLWRSCDFYCDAFTAFVSEGIYSDVIVVCMQIASSVDCFHPVLSEQKPIESVVSRSIIL